MKRIILCISIAVISSAIYSQEEIIGQTYYDLQTNGSSQNRIYVFEDGFIGATWTHGMEWSSFSDRGTGYNYFEGSVWQPWPITRIENKRTGWPSYAPLGETGELVVAHLSGADTVGLIFSKRTFKGEGGWIESLFSGPVGFEDLYWPRMVTGGANHAIIYLLALTEPIYNGGFIYHGLNGALLYSRSTDGGETWDIQNQILPGMDSTQYNGFENDCYAFAEPKDNIVAFVVGSIKTDMFLMKSFDDGQTFEKTIIWDNPYDTILPADTFYCVSGSLSVTLDASGKAHAVFGIVSAYYNTNWGTNRYTDGIGYWNEDRETFSSNINALNPEGGTGSELVPDYNLIGWSQDLNGNGQLDLLDIGQYGGYHGISSMPQIVIDDLNRIFVCYTSVTETYNQGIENYRRLWFRTSANNGNLWGQFYHFGGNDITHIFDDFIFPSCAASSDEYIYCIFLTDNEPSLNIYLESPMENYIRFVKIPKDSIVGINQPYPINGFEVSQNFPNPFTETSKIKVTMEKPAEITIDIMNLLGQKVLPSQTIAAKMGINTITIDRNGLSPGIYFYKVTTGENSVTKKMIIGNS